MIHPTAIVELREIDPTTNIWAYAHVMSGAQIGKHVQIGDHVFIEGGAVVGDNVTIKNGVCIWNGISLENDVFIGPGVTFTNDKYPRSPRMAMVQQRYSSQAHWLQRTMVRRGCSIGAGATICPGVELGAFCMIAAGAVVTRDVPAFSLVMGVPAQRSGSVCLCGIPLPSPQDECNCPSCGATVQRRADYVQTFAHST